MNYWKNKKIVVTGAGGFIGHHAVNLLESKGVVVTAVLSKKKKIKINRNVKYLRGDLLDFKFCRKVVKGQDAVLHFAAMDGGKIFKAKHSAEIYRVNTGLTINILEAARLGKIERVLIMSSTEVYPPSSSILRESDKIIYDSKTFDGYALSKISSEMLGILYQKEYGMKIAIARSGNVYGPNDIGGVEKGRVVPVFIEECLKGRDITLWGKGDQRRPFLFVDDLIEALLIMLRKHTNAEPVNIAGYQNVSIKELAQVIIKEVGSKNKIVYQKSPVKAAPLRKVSTAKAKSLGLLKNVTPLRQGIKKTVNR